MGHSEIEKFLKEPNRIVYTYHAVKVGEESPIIGFLVTDEARDKEVREAMTINFFDMPIDAANQIAQLTPEERKSLVKIAKLKSLKREVAALEDEIAKEN